MWSVRRVSPRKIDITRRTRRRLEARPARRRLQATRGQCSRRFLISIAHFRAFWAAFDAFGAHLSPFGAVLELFEQIYCVFGVIERPCLEHCSGMLGSGSGTGKFRSGSSGFSSRAVANSSTYSATTSHIFGSWPRRYFSSWLIEFQVNLAGRPSEISDKNPPHIPDCSRIGGGGFLIPKIWVTTFSRLRRF